MRDIFDPQFYVSEYPDVQAAGINPYKHYAQHGVTENRLPNRIVKIVRLIESSSFDLLIGDLVQALRPLSFKAQCELLKTLLAIAGLYAFETDKLDLPRAQKSASLTKLLLALTFNEDQYLRRYPDMGGLDSPQEHYICHGAGEQRCPSVWFDPRWYEGAYEGVRGSGLSPAEHFLFHGLQDGLLPFHEIFYVVDRYKSERIDFIELCILSKLEINCSLYGDDFNNSIKYFCKYFDPVALRKSGIASGSASVMEVIYLYLSTLDAEERPLSEAFDQCHYTTSRNIEAAGGADRLLVALLHWEMTGIHDKAISNSTYYNKSYYLKAHPDIRSDFVNPVEHVMLHGLFEHRRLNEYPPIAQPVRVGPGKSFSERGRHISLLDNQRDPSGLPMDNVSRLLASSAIGEMIRAAQLIEPDIQPIDACNISLCPPYSEKLNYIFQILISKLRRESFDYVVAVPWMRMGGSDYIASILARSLYENGKNTVLIIQTDHAASDRADWFDGLDDRLMFADIVGDSLSTGEQEYILYALINWVNPASVFNVNSNLLFSTIVRFGARMKEHRDLYCYYFCWDQLEDGRRVGYPSIYFPRVFEWCAGSITDSEYLRNELIDFYRIPERIAERIAVFKTPAQIEGAPDIAPAPAADRARPLILWAGRFDRQKRFDLACRIASEMPWADFHVWGVAVIDEGKEQPNIPLNMKLHAPYKDFSELPLAEASCWLYTSGWDGIPTILVELGARAVPIVASDAGGVSELIGEETGWLIGKDAGVESYVAAIAEVVEHPDLARRKGQALRDLVCDQHSIARYAQGIEGLLAT